MFVRKKGPGMDFVGLQKNLAEEVIRDAERDLLFDKIHCYFDQIKHYVQNHNEHVYNLQTIDSKLQMFHKLMSETYRDLQVLDSY